jgi:hypothetical protein
MTRAEQIVAALHNSLATTPELVSGNVWRSRLRKIPEGDNLAIVIRLGPDRRGEESTLGSNFRNLAVYVEVYARGDIPDQLADPVIEQIIDRLMADRTLSGLCDDIRPGDKIPDWAARDTDLVVIDLEFMIDYEISNNLL